MLVLGSRGGAVERAAFDVRFATGPRLEADEKYFPWDEDCGGTVGLDEDVIRLTGKRKTGAAADLVTLGPAQQLLKRSLAQDMTVLIPTGDLVRVVVRQRPGKKTAAFRLYQRQDDGMVSVHGFVTGTMAKDPDPGQVIAWLQAVVPPGSLTDEASEPLVVATPAGWFDDPAGRHQLRFWDGVAWTAQVADDGEQSVDALLAES